MKLFAVAAIGALLFTSCQKEKLEGQYMPEKQLSSIRTANIQEINGAETESMVLVANYNWDGKLLSGITTVYEEDNSGYSKTTFTYDSQKRVSGVTVESDYITTLKLFYNDKDLAKVEVHMGDDLDEEYLFTKTDGKLTEITRNSNGSDKKGDLSSLNYFFPEQIVKAMEAAASVTEKGETTVTKLTWEGDNIVKSELVSTAATLTTEFTYDEKVNPLCGLFGQGFYSTPENIFSVNNILSEIAEMPFIGTLVTNHTYEYDGDYPVNNTIETQSGMISSKNILTYTYK